MQVWTGGPETADVISLDAASCRLCNPYGQWRWNKLLWHHRNEQRRHYSGITLVVSDGTNQYHNTHYYGNGSGVSVSITDAVWDLGVIPPGHTLQMTESSDITIINDGPVSESFTLELTEPSGWTSGSTASQDIYVMKGLLVHTGDGTSNPPGDSPSDTDFGADDVITTSSGTASSSIFGYAGGSATGAGVTSGSSVDLWLQFTAPTDTSTRVNQLIEITIGAIPF